MSARLCAVTDSNAQPADTSLRIISGDTEFSLDLVSFADRQDDKLWCQAQPVPLQQQRLWFAARMARWGADAPLVQLNSSTDGSPVLTFVGQSHEKLAAEYYSHLPGSLALLNLRKLMLRNVAPTVEEQCGCQPLAQTVTDTEAWLVWSMCRRACFVTVPPPATLLCSSGINFCRCPAEVSIAPEQDLTSASNFLLLFPWLCPGVWLSPTFSCVPAAFAANKTVLQATQPKVCNTTLVR